jgi:hypothetical protein
MGFEQLKGAIILIKALVFSDGNYSALCSVSEFAHADLMDLCRLARPVIANAFNCVANRNI